MKKKVGAILVIAALLLSGICFFVISKSNKDIETSQTLVVVSPHPKEFMIPLIQEFESETGIRTTIISSGTSNAIESIENGEDVDVLWGGSILSVGPYKDYFYPYVSLNRAVYKEKYKKVDDEFTCFSDVPSILIVNEDIIGDTIIEGYEDLLKPELKGEIAFADPAKSSSSFEHLVNMLYAMGDGNADDGWEYVGKLIDQLDGKLLTSSSEVYTGVANGKYKVGLTFEEAAVTMLKNDKHIRIVYMEEGVVTTPDGIYINKNTDKLTEAERFVNFMTSKNTQVYMASELGRRSVRKDVEPSSLVIADDEIHTISVKKDRVVNSKSLWTDRFSAMYREKNHE
jgi:iron(III) transport system substrate-binding protein